MYTCKCGLVILLAIIHCSQYMELAHTLSGYNHVNFPHCECDARKAGHVIMSVSTTGIVLKACTEEGILQVRHSVCVCMNYII